MPVDDYDNEITNLRKVFNHMFYQLMIMKRVKDEERRLQKES